MDELTPPRDGTSGADGGVAYFVDRQPRAADFEHAVIAGLRAARKEIPAKFFYDDEGSHIFNRICGTEEYYVTRTEIGLLSDRSDDIRRLAGPGTVVIEYGCGSAAKINLLLDALKDPAEYAAIDISPEHLRFVVEDISARHPGLRVGGICADFTGGFELPSEVGGGGTKLGFFPGSTIGNQTPEEARGFLRRVRENVGDGGALLIGVDLKKDAGRLNRAYNDEAGHTADFNLNLLRRIERELDSEVNVDGFEHHAFYNEGEGRIEMHLRAKSAQRIRIGGETFRFSEGETIHTENSYKYTIGEFARLAAGAGFAVGATWTDAEDLFSIHFLKAA